MNEQINKLIEQHLAYQDAPLEDGAKTAALESTVASESAVKYATVLELLEQEGKLEETTNLAGRLKDECLDYLDEIGVKTMPYTESNSWAMWDIAKQLHMSQNPHESDPTRYELGDPLTNPRVQSDIVNRHLGWELYALLRQDNSLLQKIEDGPKNQILALVSKDPKPDNGTLASSDLTTLGRLFRENYVT